MSLNMIAGYYDLFWMEAGVSSSAASLGATGPDGFEMEEIPEIVPITGDAYGPKTVVDFVYQGGNMFLNFVVQEVKLTAVKKFLQAWTQSVGTPTFGEYRMGTPGAFAETTAFGTLQAIVRTSTPAASYYASGNHSFQFKGIPVGPLRRTLDTRPRFIPVRFQCVPFEISSGVMGWAKVIAAAS